MGLIRKIKSFFHNDWCGKCQIPMEQRKRELFMLPMMVGHYTTHKNKEYYIKNLIKVDKKADIPTGYYACGIIEYQCPNCRKKITELSIFLPVRDSEKYEDTILFENGELDEFMNNPWKKR